MDILTILLFGLVVVLTHFLEGITGFGCTVLAMPFSIMLLGMEVAKPVLTLYALLLCLIFVVKGFRQIQWKHYLKMMGMLIIGLPIGIMAYQRLPRKPLIIALAIFMAVTSIRGLLLSFDVVKKKGQVKDIPALICVFLGGIIHGAYSSGGPLVIIYATEKIKQKSQFRATLCLIWVTLNTVILLQMIVAGDFTAKVTRTAVYGLPFLIIGAIVGNLAHDKMNETFFTRFTYLVLLVSGVFMLV